MLWSLKSVESSTADLTSFLMESEESGSLGFGDDVVLSLFDTGSSSLAFGHCLCQSLELDASSSERGAFSASAAALAHPL
jgi:hypothetical protein